jgi:hypothetical protein
MEWERLEAYIRSLADIYIGLAEELRRMRSVTEARDDSFSRFDRAMKEKLEEKDRLILSLRSLIGPDVSGAGGSTGERARGGTGTWPVHPS